uniref:Uncharacterized protein n=1 Tax=Meloidogyne incognita TaxID=6306 RepID=A0A914LMS1_MELIC
MFHCFVRVSRSLENFYEACELLREGRLFDDYALEEQESAEEMTEELQSFVRIQKIRMYGRT